MSLAILAIPADLAAPPSKPVIFRDITLYSKITKRYDAVLAYSPKEMIDFYAVWFKRYGLFDYVDDILTRKEIINPKYEILAPRLNYENYLEVLSQV